MSTLTLQQREIIDALIASRATITASTIADRIRSDSPGTVKVQIHHVRRLCPDIGQHIETVRGDGYRWTGPRVQRA